MHDAAVWRRHPLLLLEPEGTREEVERRRRVVVQECTG
jgi:hypothetical protein